MADRDQFTEYPSNSDLDPIWQKMLERALREIDQAYAPYSHFKVVAVGRTAQGKILTGTNQENSSFQAGICAERNLVYHAMHEDPDLHMERLLIYTSAEFARPQSVIAPCGICRQTLAELEFKQEAPIEVLFPGENGSWILSRRMEDLLPFAFRLK